LHVTFGTKKDEILHFVQDDNAGNVDAVGRLSSIDNGYLRSRLQCGKC